MFFNIELSQRLNISSQFNMMQSCLNKKTDKMMLDQNEFLIKVNSILMSIVWLSNISLILCFNEKLHWLNL